MKFTLTAMTFVSSGMIIRGVHSELHSGKKRQDPYTNSTSWSPQYSDRGDDVTCRNSMLGDDHPHWRCVGPASPPKPKKYPTDHNQTYTHPECPSGYTPETIIERTSETNIGQCQKQSKCREVDGKSKTFFGTTIAGQCVSVFILLLFLATIVFDPHSYFHCVVAGLYYYCYHFIDYIS